VVLLILGTGLAIIWYKRNEDAEPAGEVKLAALADPKPTPSQRATLPYFLIAILLFIVQALVGSVTGHYAVEGNKLFGIDTGSIIPYAATRTWHLQLAVFWIATCWLATGLFIGPAVGGVEPKGQKALVLTLLGALVVVVVGALGGSWASVVGRFGGDGFLFGTRATSTSSSAASGRWPSSPAWCSGWCSSTARSSRR
jgi:nitric oxide reductase subunit B